MPSELVGPDAPELAGVKVEPAGEPGGPGGGALRHEEVGAEAVHLVRREHHVSDEPAEHARGGEERPARHRDEERVEAYNVGVQLDLNLQVLHRLPMMLSVGYARGFEGDGQGEDEFMLSLKVL